MGKSDDGITPELSYWIQRQHIFFVATAPLAHDGLINCSPKGMDTFRILGPREVAYLDLTGSGIETVANARENRADRIHVLRVRRPAKDRSAARHGEVHVPGSAQFDSLSSQFPAYVGGRAIIHTRITRVSDSCGYGVPQYRYGGDRQTLVRWSESKGPDGLAQYRQTKNARSLNGLSGLTVTLPASVDQTSGIDTER